MDSHFWEKATVSRYAGRPQPASWFPYHGIRRPAWFSMPVDVGLPGTVNNWQHRPKPHSTGRYLVRVTRPNQHKKFQSRRDHLVSDHDRSGCANAGAMDTVLPKALRPPQDRDTRATWAPPKQ
jgi:hypothetical protein